MATYIGGTRVQSGYYLNTSKLAIANVEKDGGALPGGSETRWKRVPTLLVLAAAPVVGGLFVVTLPLVGFGAATYAIGRKLAGRARAGATEIAATVAPTMVPGQAHLTGEPPRGGAAEGEPPEDERMQALEKEIAEKRNPPE
jgi:hypothetical protein